MNGANTTFRHAVQWAASATAAVGLSGLIAGCAHVKVDPLEVKPITVNVNVNLRVQQQLDQFFSFEDKLLTGDTSRPGTAPATAPTAEGNGVH